MANVFDIAQYILKTVPKPITTVKLRLLLYYSQAWHLVWSDNPLFSENIYKSRFGLFIPELQPYIGEVFNITSLPVGNSDNLTEEEQDSVDGTVNYYGLYESCWLKDLITSEDPWKDTAVNEVIPLGAMYNYYSSL